MNICHERNVNNQRTANQSHHDYVNARYVNTGSIRNKVIDLEELVALKNFHISAVAESRLIQKIDFIGEFNLPGCSVFLCDRENRIGGLCHLICSN